MDCSLKAVSVSKQFEYFFKEPKKVISEFTLNAQAGEIIAIVGENGSGKTTILKLLCGLIKPSTGTISVCGYDLQKNRSDAVFHLGGLFEGARSLHWQLSIWENMLYYGRLKGRTKSETERSAEQLLKKMNLFDQKNVPAGQFSRGIQQRLSVATLLITDPSVLIIDEPTLGIDAEALLELRILLGELAHEWRKTILFATHNSELVATTATQVIVLQNGTVKLQQSTRELFAYQRQEKYRLKVRETEIVTKLFSKFNIQHHAREAELLVIEFLPSHSAQLSELCFALQEYKADLVSIEQIVPSLAEIYTHAMTRSSVSV